MLDERPFSHRELLLRRWRDSLGQSRGMIVVHRYLVVRGGRVLLGVSIGRRLF